VIQQIGKVDEDRVKLALVAALVGMKVLVADVCVLFCPFKLIFPAANWRETNWTVDLVLASVRAMCVETHFFLAANVSISTLVNVGACIANQSEPGRTFTRKTVMPFGSTLPLAHVTLSLTDVCLDTVAG